MNAQPSIDLSVCIITFNEAEQIRACLESLPRGCQIILLDSGSTDGTQELAREFGAEVHERAFTDYSEQKNAAIDYASRQWILSIDADERLSQEFVESVGSIIDHSQAAGFRLHRYLIFMGRRLRFGRSSDRPLRLFRRGAGRFHGTIHESVQVDGPVHGYPEADVIAHLSYADLNDYFLKFNSYTSKIAASKFARGEAVPASHILRPWWEFFSRYILQGGFLDGYPGYCYAVVSSLYTYVKYAKLKELKAQSIGE